MKVFRDNLLIFFLLEKFVYSGNILRNEIGDDFVYIMKYCLSFCYFDLSFSGFGDVEMKIVFDVFRYVLYLVFLNLSGCKLVLISMKYLCVKFCYIS